MDFPHSPDRLSSPHPYQRGDLNDASLADFQADVTGDPAAVVEGLLTAINRLVDEVASLRETATVDAACSSAEVQLLEEELDAVLREAARTRELLDVRLALDATLAQSQLDERWMREVLAHFIPSLADWGAIDWSRPDGKCRRTVLHRSQRMHPQAKLLETLTEERDPLWKALHTARDGIQRFYPEVSVNELSPGTAADRRDLLVELGLRSVIILPLHARGMRLGALTLVGDWSRPALTPSTFKFMEGVAAAIAVALLADAGEATLDTR